MDIEYRRSLSALPVFLMPDGLPASLEGGPEGFNALCALLGIVGRQEKRQLHNHPRVRKALRVYGRRHAPRTKTAVRIRKDLTRFYSIADLRTEVWATLYRATDRFREPPKDMIPCLEYVALRNYGADLSAGAPTDAELSGFGDFIDLDEGQLDWSAPALAALPSVHADLKNWDSLEWGGKRSAMLAAFAVCTLLGDARLVHWARELNAELAEEFEFAAEDMGVDEREYDPEFEAVLDVPMTCGKLIKAAHELSQDPFEAALFDEVERVAAQLESLRAPVMEYRQLAKTAGALEEMYEFFRKRADGDDALRGRLPEIKDAWNKTDIGPSNAVREAVAEARRDAAGLFDQWDKARAETERIARRLSAGEERLAAATDDVADERELEVAKFRYEHLLAAQEKRVAEDRIVAAMSAPALSKKTRSSRSQGKGDAGPAPSASPGRSPPQGAIGALKGMFGKRGR